MDNLIGQSALLNVRINGYLALEAERSLFPSLSRCLLLLLDLLSSAYQCILSISIDKRASVGVLMTSAGCITSNRSWLYDAVGTQPRWNARPVLLVSDGRENLREGFRKEMFAFFYTLMEGVSRFRAQGHEGEAL